MSVSWFTLQGRIEVTNSCLQKLESGHPWIFSGALRAPTIKNAGLVEVFNQSGVCLGVGYYNPKSQIAIRMLSRTPVQNWSQWLTTQLAKAMQQRALTYPKDTAVRLVFAEADGLPGLIIDRFGSTASVQCNSLFAHHIRSEVIDWLSAQGIHHFWDASDESMLNREGITHASTHWLSEPPSSDIILHEGVARFYALTGKSAAQKTGFYLDQRTNRQITTNYTKGDILDVCAYTGGFSIHAALSGKARCMTCIDASEGALEGIRKHITLNQLSEKSFELIKADMFHALGELHTAGRQFDTIILDPPKLVKSKAQKLRGLKGYRHLNKMALKLLRPGGCLITYSCSGTVSAGEFEHTLHEACWEAGAQMQVLQHLRQDHDHPIVTSFPESLYLKGLILRKLS
jgi:23S rRNA (cytosine1962-C5)-methyltransferase